MNLLVVGLGNPGRQYDETRHNVGFDFLESIAKICGIHFKRGILLPAEVGKGFCNGNKIILVKPRTFMNCSGDIFPKILQQHDMDPSNLLVVCDNMDLEVGTARLKLKGSSAGQKGLQSIIRKLGTDQFMRLYIGVGKPLHKDGVVDYVLGRPSLKDRTQIEQILSFSVDWLLKISELGVDRVINEINSQKPSEK